MKKYSRKIRFKTIILTIIILLFSTAVFSSELWDVYATRLQTSSVYKTRQLQLMSAQQKVKQYADFFVPYISLNVGNSASSGFQYSEVHKADAEETDWSTVFGMSLNINLLHVLGTDIGMILPFEYTNSSNGESDIDMNHVSFTANRQLITEEYAKELGNKAELLNAVYNIEQQEWTVLLQLVRDVFNQIYYETQMELTELKIEIYDRKLNNEKDEDIRDNYRQQKLLAEKTGLTSQKMLNSIDVFGEDELNTLYNEILLTVPSLYSEYDEKDFLVESADIKALRLEMKKAYEEKELWFLPYIINPQFNFKLDYYFDESNSLQNYGAGDWSWSIGVSGSLDVMDRGENEVAALNRQNSYGIKQLQLEDSLKQKERLIEQYCLDIEISDIDLSLKQLEMTRAIEDAQEAVELYKNGYITAEDKELELMNRDQKKLDYLQVLHQLYINELELMKESGIILGGYSDEEKN